MIEKEYAERVVTEKREIITVTCDICGKKVEPHAYYFQGVSQGKDKEADPSSYAEKGEFEVCSGECLMKKMEELEYFFENFAELKPSVDVQYVHKSRDVE